ncbi:hypothetical protein BST97_14550 [Nonlabens spongiae]|uniref:Abasic site processing protein n=1 Tax=Nonlabens spongiae TaxID=331648 RepID=A0A1W6MNM4_9FLAO|nr:SOS response-associated peptidase [Nonlabens spongiae]ARN79106.1 hypothetical protein BST97_14550 [Nonlabens spongiae]
MCGRATLLSNHRIVEKRFNASYIDQPFENVNISAGNKVPVITCEHPNHIQNFTLGFTPSWAHKQTYIINARAEGSNNLDNDPHYIGPQEIHQKPMFRKAIKSQRCLVIVDAFIEGSKYEKLNKPFLVYPTGKSQPFALAGIYDTWENPLTGKIHHTVAIVTTAANRLMQRIGHHRSPLALTKIQEEEWLNTDLPKSKLNQIMKPFDPKYFNAYPISKKIKSPDATGITLLKPIGQSVYKEHGRTFYDQVKYEEDNIYSIKAERLVEGDQFVLF